MKRALLERKGDLLAILALFAVAVGVAGYILPKQRLRFPFLDPKPFELKAELATAQAVTPGQGQTVRVAGVRIGDIERVALEDGRAVLTLAIEPEYKGLVRTDATALLRPKTGLKDMFLEVAPGDGRAAPRGFAIPVSNTLPDVNLDEILAELDADTRDQLALLIGGAGAGLRGRGGDLRDVLRRFEPTHRDIARVASAVAERRTNLRRLIGSLAQLNTTLASRQRQLTELVGASAQVFRSFASEDANVTRAIADFPPALRQTTATLGSVDRFAAVLRPAADRLRPAVRALDRANAAVRPFAAAATPVLRDRIRPFVREARPVVRDLRPAALDLARATPDLTADFVVLNHLFNLAAFNPKGAEAPGVPGRQEGYLFWIAWVTHQTANLFSQSTANSVLRPAFLGGSCAALGNLVGQHPELEAVLNLTPILASTEACG
jgi:phospholipid/cholesterol/gamma-HCH transport system substrate-binding protein